MQDKQERLPSILWWAFFFFARRRRLSRLALFCLRQPLACALMSRLMLIAKIAWTEFFAQNYAFSKNNLIFALNFITEKREDKGSYQHP
ncbi:MAG: hypothetical protein HUK03_06145 [Bacteroidaceae bacterium]|nr:hypothetical protein [Bacteroidaceae bacterium]